MIEHTAKPVGPLAPQYINWVYIPTVVLAAGIALVKVQWTPLALIAALALGGFQYYSNRTIP